MAPPAVRPYGAWRSSLTAARAAAGKLRFDHLLVDGDDVYWGEGRASEGGRYVIVRCTPDGRITDVTPRAFNVRTRVHEYGGAAFTVHGGTAYFSNFDDQRLYRQRTGAAPEALTMPGRFYAECRVDAARRRLIGVREDHSRAPAEAVNCIVAVPIDPNGAGLDMDRDLVLVSGADFYSDPILSPDGSRLAWLQWNHPNMPWDATELWVATIAPDGTPGAGEKVAGGSSESIFQPEWTADGTLLFVSDRSGYWNLYRRAEAGVECLQAMAADFGKAQWTFSQKTYAVVDANRLAVTYTEDGRWKLAVLELQPRRFVPIECSHEPLEGICMTPGAVWFVGGSPIEPAAIVRVPLAGGSATVVRSSKAGSLSPEWISRAEPITFDADGREVYGFYYPPTNPHCVAPEGERPPLHVLSHGGPTASTLDVLDEEVQFWTSRGFAVLDVNYSGSSGYGRSYRDRLKGQWGVVDVTDCVHGALHLVAAGKADRNRLIIRGGSAGGYTTLSALTFWDVFSAGASYYGISDLEVLARDTHKFESRYLDTLVGPYPQQRALYRQRSPIHYVDRLSCALILFQGLDDKVVPPNQSEMMAAAVRRKGLPVAYVAFPGEQHGFRKAESLVRSMEAELFFYGAVFGFTPADSIEPVAIDNLR